MKKAMASVIIFVVAIVMLSATLFSIKINSLEKSNSFSKENLEDNSIEKVTGITMEPSKNNSLVMRWNEVSNVNGYEIQLTKELSVMKFYTTNSKIVFQNFGNNIYQVYIRGYRELEDNVKIYGEFSEPVTLEINSKG